MRGGRGVRVYARAMLFTVLMISVLIAASAAFAGTNSGEGGAGPLNSVAPASLAQDIGKAVQEVGMPLGGAILLLAVIITAVQIIISRFNPGQRENAMTNLWYVGLGGIILGGALFFASLFFNIGGTYFQ